MGALAGSGGSRLVGRHSFVDDVLVEGRVRRGRIRVLGLLQADYGILCRTVCRESRYWVHSTVTVDEDKKITFDFDVDSIMFRGGKDNRLISAEAQKQE